MSLWYLLKFNNNVPLTWSSQIAWGLWPWHSWQDSKKGGSWEQLTWNFLVCCIHNAPHLVDIASMSMGLHSMQCCYTNPEHKVTQHLQSIESPLITIFNTLTVGSIEQVRLCSEPYWSLETWGKTQLIFTKYIWCLYSDLYIEIAYRFSVITEDQFHKTVSKIKISSSFTELPFRIDS